MAEGLRDMELPADAALAKAEWQRRLNDAIVAWNRGAGVDIGDLNELAAQVLTSTVNYCSRTTSCCPCLVTPPRTVFGRWGPRNAY